MAPNDTVDFIYISPALGVNSPIEYRVGFNTITSSYIPFPDQVQAKSIQDGTTHDGAVATKFGKDSFSSSDTLTMVASSLRWNPTY
jgi:hypothetical protein